MDPNGSMRAGVLEQEVHETQERLDVADFLRDRPFDKGLDFFFAHLEAIAADAKPKKVNGGLMELAFFGRCVELPFAEDGKDFSDMLGVFCDAAAVNQDIVKVDDHEMVKERAESVVDELLEGRGSIRQTKRHNKILEMAIAGPERGLPFVSFLDADKVVGAEKVDLGKNDGALQLVKVVRNQRQRVAVLHGDRVQLAVVDARTQTSLMRLGNKKHGRAARRLAGSNKASL